MRPHRIVLTATAAVLSALAAAPAASADTQPAPQAEIVTLGTLGGHWSGADDVNDQGQVVGQSATSSGPGHAFLWQDGQMIDLGTLGGETSWATGIDEDGRVAGCSQVPSGTSHAFVWWNGEMHDLGESGPGYCDVAVSRGHIVRQYAPDPAQGYAGMRVEMIQTPSPDPATWHRIDVAMPPGMNVADINDSGQVVGEHSLDNTVNGGRMYLWHDGTGRDLGTFGVRSNPEAINEPGRIVGDYATSDGGQSPFYWDGVMRPLPMLDGVRYAGAQDINARGDIVGTYTESTTLRLRSLYWSTPTSAPVPLPVNVDASEVGAEAINNRGWIVGHVRHAWPSDLDTRAVIWKIRR